MPKIDKAKMKCNKPKRQISGGKRLVIMRPENRIHNVGLRSRSCNVPVP